MRHLIRNGSICFATIIALATTGPARAELLDLTKANSSGMINGAIFATTDTQPTGTGVIDPFLRLQRKGTEQGYNTDYRYPPGNKMEFDQKSDPNYTRSLLLSEVPVVTIDGTAYRQFLLDINESNGGGRELLSLDQLQLFQSNTPTARDYGKNQANLGTEIYSLDPNNTVLLNYDLGRGSGSGDMFAYIPDSLFDPSIPYVYLYSRFGDDYGADGDSDAGFEEWAVLKGTTPPPPVNGVPAPATLIFALMGCGAGLLGYAGRKLRAHRAR